MKTYSCEGGGRMAWHAVRSGWKEGLYESWDEAMEQIKGHSQPELKTFALESGTVPSVTEALVQQLTAAFPDLSADALREEMAQGLESGEASYDLTKSDWKYGTSRAVFATPAYFINQVALYGEGEHPEGQLAAFTVDEWREILDPIVNASRRLLIHMIS